MNTTFAVALAVALPALAYPALAGEIIIVDPYGGVTRSEMPTSHDAKVDKQTGADRARSWSGGNQGRTGQDAVVVVPQSGGNTVVIVPSDGSGPGGGASGNAARDAISRAGAYAHGDDSGAAAVTDGDQAIIIIDNGQVHSADEASSEAANRAKMSAAKARVYSQGSKPCGSVVVGGIGEGGQQSANTATKDVYVVNTNCR